MVSLEALVMKLGMVPENLLIAKPRYSILGSARSVLEGRFPERELLNRSISFTADMLKIVDSTTPTRLLDQSHKVSRLRRLPTSSGISPAKTDATSTITKPFLRREKKSTYERK